MALQDEGPEERVVGQVIGRLIPFIFLCYVVAYIDRVNIGFAATAMQKDLGLSDAVYGFGAGLFFLGYCVFEVPSNLILERVGARRINDPAEAAGSLAGAGATDDERDGHAGESPERKC